MLKHGIFWQPVGSELAVFTSHSDDVFTLNESAGVIFEALAEGTDRDEIATRLQHRFDAPLEDCQRVVDVFTTRLDREGLLA